MFATKSVIKIRYREINSSITQRYTLTLGNSGLSIFQPVSARKQIRSQVVH